MEDDVSRYIYFSSPFVVPVFGLDDADFAGRVFRCFVVVVGFGFYAVTKVNYERWSVFLVGFECVLLVLVCVCECGPECGPFLLMSSTTAMCIRFVCPFFFTLFSSITPFIGSRFAAPHKERKKRPRQQRLCDSAHHSCVNSFATAQRLNVCEQSAQNVNFWCEDLGCHIL